MVASIDQGSIVSTSIASGVSSATFTTSTAGPKEVIVLFIGNAPSSSSIQSSNGLQYVQRGVASNPPAQYQEFVAISPQALSNETITINFSTSTSGIVPIIIFAISGLNTISLFDNNSSIPQAVATVNFTSGTPLSTTYSTNNANDFIVALSSCINSTTLVITNTDFTQITTTPVVNRSLGTAYYRIANSSVNNETVTSQPDGEVATQPISLIVDAFEIAPEVLTPTIAAPRLPVYTSIGIDPIAGTFFKPVQTPILGASVVQSLPVSGIVGPINVVMLAGGGNIKGHIFTNSIR